MTNGLFARYPIEDFHAARQGSFWIRLLGLHVGQTCSFAVIAWYDDGWCPSDEKHWHLDEPNQISSTQPNLAPLVLSLSDVRIHDLEIGYHDS